MSGFCTSKLLFHDAVEILSSNCIYFQETFKKKTQTKREKNPKFKKLNLLV